MSKSEPFQIVTDVEIEASPQVVWDELTNFASFAGWNPFMVEASGTATLGSRLTVRMHPPGGSVMTFKPTVTQAKAPERFEWLGSVMVRGLFDGRHRFELQGTESGTRLIQSEQFTGLLVPFLRKSLETNTRAGFEAMNDALKERVEKLRAG